MRVLMRIDMRNVDTRPLKLLHLRKRLNSNLILADLAQKHGPEKIHKGRPKVLPIRTKQSRNTLRMRKRRPIRQHDMAANAERRIRQRYSNSIIKRSAISHQRSRRNRPS